LDHHHRYIPGSRRCAYPSNNRTPGVPVVFPVKNRQIRASKAIQRQTGTTFYVATKVLPKRVREPTYVLYAFFRVADEVVDDPDGATPAEQHAELERIRAAALGEEPTDDPVLSAVDECRRRHDIPDREIDLFIDAMQRDIDTDRYDTYDALREYMRGSAVAVGHMMTAIMDPDDPERAAPHAAALGEAFQLTNFLRDVGEDIRDHDRIYLPGTTRERHGVTEAQIEAREYDAGVRAAMADELARTERRYYDGVAGIEYLPADCQFPVLLAAVLYADHHRLIRNAAFDTLSQTPELSTTRKLALAARTRWHWQWTDDPMAVFERVSAIPPAPEVEQTWNARSDGQALASD
jgi:phytoene synthase